VKKHNFDQTPKLLETFDQLIRSSEIRSSDRFPWVGQISLDQKCHFTLDQKF
jgi:hypothetical protein